MGWPRLGLALRRDAYDYRRPVIAAEAAIQDGALPGTRLVPPTPPALRITHSIGQPLPSQGFLDCGLRRNDDRGGISVAILD